ncbi:S1/P1 nuclease [Bradyrhizobium brasilense]|uniref:S1/P1 nuclease n=1 Tax=Bradyrhizobium brasilense TaxID=1419277 RepID=UPI001E3C516D|nr:S1/P1 nuclease [Bradyrhizobium brasilense]MCC8972549.1 hypothetical protein [Bradyrhizobium brasilense]
MSKLAATLSLLVALLLPQRAFAWNATGHQIVGSIADQLLTVNASRQVKLLLGVGLREAGPWLDCVKSVRKQPDGTLSYSPPKEEYDKPCKAFSNDHSAMIDYVGRNWVNCVYPEVPNTSANTGCHNTYHFDDVAVQRDRFDRNYVGTNDHDLVAAINAAIAVLLDRPAPPPFDIKNKREALFMLAHLVGDLGQPLHVAAPYLGPDGSLVDPDVTHTIDPSTETAGGNWIKDGASDNFHSEWDDNPKDLTDTAPQALVDAARALPPQTGAIEDWSVAWATDTIAVAKRAMAKVKYTQTGPRLWSIDFQDGHDAYFRDADQTKKDQYVKCGARLAAILNKIWP